jgi:hypothetical protein
MRIEDNGYDVNRRRQVGNFPQAFSHPPADLGRARHLRRPGRDKPGFPDSDDDPGSGQHEANATRHVVTIIQP